MENNWVKFDPPELRTGDIANNEATSDWLNFDCVCQDKNAPDYEDKPYDFPIPNLAYTRFTCSRCGREYRLQVHVAVEMYEPLALRYPNAKDKMQTLGLRTEE